VNNISCTSDYVSHVNISLMNAAAFYILNGEIQLPPKDNFDIYNTADDVFLDHEMSPFRSGFLSLFGMYVMILGFFNPVWLEDDRSLKRTYANVGFFILFM